MKNNYVKLAFLFFLLFVASCTKEDIITKGSNQSQSEIVLGDFIRLTVQTAPTVVQPVSIDKRSRVSYEDAAVDKDAAPFKWEAGDQLMLVNKANPSQYVTLDLETGAGTAQASFKGNIIEGVDKYEIYYTRVGHHLKYIDGIWDVDYSAQTQTANNSTAHLKDYLFMQGQLQGSDATTFTAENLKDAQIVMNTKNTVVRFDLDTISAGLGKLSALEWILNAGDANEESHTLKLNGNAEVAKFTAFLCFTPKAALGNGKKVQVKLTDDLKHTVLYEAQAGRDVTYAASKRYIATVNFPSYVWNFDDNQFPADWVCFTGNGYFQDGWLHLKNDAQVRYNKEVGLGMYTWKMNIPTVTESLQHLMGVSLYTETGGEKMIQMYSFYGKSEHRLATKAQSNQMVLRLASTKDSFVAVDPGEHVFGFKLSRNAENAIYAEWIMDGKVILYREHYPADTKFSLSLQNVTNKTWSWLSNYADKPITGQEFDLSFDYFKYEPFI